MFQVDLEVVSVQVDTAVSVKMHTYIQSIGQIALTIVYFITLSVSIQNHYFRSKHPKYLICDNEKTKYCPAGQSLSCVS